MFTCVGTGCSEVDFGGPIRVPAEQRQTLTLQSEPRMLHLPGDQVFNVHSGSGQRSAALPAGSAEQAEAHPDGTARCVAQAGPDGQATANFQLGHQFDLLADGPAELRVDVSLAIDHALQAPAQPAAGTMAETGLRLAVLNARNRALVSLPILQLTSDVAAGKGGGTYHHQVSAILETSGIYNVVLIGQAAAAAKASQEASAQLALNNVQMTLTIMPGPASQPAEK